MYRCFFKGLKVDVEESIIKDELSAVFTRVVRSQSTL
jgi:hypothetical protein